ncbi:hypothetical protein DFR70_105147 [Nocardia tenerifensis]|uniref:Tetratricopeptide repeat protein n=1 Tax=Nocardia tenerifensis TaxID=228006 RepID=A0A318KNG7_9NOCA|nr:hypothetical protein [Nocardia tenerifensis]PXX63965.1 hypothetical protein DFR70_105147 [Nocardia tenerifensis]
MPDDTMTAITHAVTLGHEGRPDEARESLLTLWNSFGPQGDPLHRCTLAHYLADLYDDAAEALTWDIRALDAADSLTDARTRQFDSALDVRGFYPSLHLNLADNYRRLGSFAAARRAITAAKETLHTLPENPYGTMIRTAVEEVEAAIAARDTSRRASAPTGRR